MKISAIPDTKSIRVEVHHRCGHIHGYRVEHYEAARQLNANVAPKLCPMCMEAIEQNAKDGGETTEQAGWSECGFERCQEAVAMFLASVDDKYRGKRITLVDDSQIEERGNGTVRLTINCVVR